MDDEYFLVMLSMRIDVFDHPEIRKHVYPKVRRSLSRPNKLGFAKAFASNLHPITLISGTGRPINTAMYIVEALRIDRVVERITKGLFFFEYGFRLPTQYGVVVWTEDRLQSLDEEGRQTITRLIGPVHQNPVKVIGENVFSFRHASTAEDPNVSAWLLSFYDKVRFLSLITPTNLQLPGNANE